MNYLSNIPCHCLSRYNVLMATKSKNQKPKLKDSLKLKVAPMQAAKNPQPRKARKKKNDTETGNVDDANGGADSKDDVNFFVVGP